MYICLCVCTHAKGCASLHSNLKQARNQTLDELMIMIFYFDGNSKTRGSFVWTSALLWPRQSKGHLILSPPCMLSGSLGHVDRHSHDVTTSTGPIDQLLLGGPAMDLSLSCEAEGNKRARVVDTVLAGSSACRGATLTLLMPRSTSENSWDQNFSWPPRDPADPASRACWEVFKPRAHAHPPTDAYPWWTKQILICTGLLIRKKNKKIIY